MEAFKIVLLVLASSLAVLAAVYGIAYFVIKRLRGKAIIALRSDTAGERVYHVTDCNFFGLLSSGLAQVRGNGLLALTDKGLRFRMLTPQRTLFISRESIRDVSHPRWFLKKSKARDLLRVDFVNAAGEEDAAAWIVGDLPWWDEAIAALESGREPPSRPQHASVFS